MTTQVETGLDRLADDPDLQRALRGRRLGLLVNPAAVTKTLRHAVEVTLELGLDVVRLFGPEHGVWGHAQDMESVTGDLDPITGLPVVSLYGASRDTLIPPLETLSDLEVLLVDLPDTGARYYTFAATALFAASVAARAGVRVWVLDRPNPIGGERVEGNRVEAGFESFVGTIAVANRHALTLAELLRYAERYGARGVLQAGSDLGLRIVPALGWRRSLWHDETGLPWVMPSPNMPTLSTATVYPGMCLLEATNLSEGRGTTRPFELFGAPWVDARRLAAELAALSLPGLAFRTTSFSPGFQKWAGQVCQGLQVHVLDRRAAPVYELGLAVVWAARRCFPEAFAWREKAYEFVDDIPAIDLLCGTDRVRRAIDAGMGFDSVLEAACPAADLSAYSERAAAVKLYR
jgi:uncharacterized protein YbbC (DUF1343 family)